MEFICQIGEKGELIYSYSNCPLNFRKNESIFGMKLGETKNVYHFLYFSKLQKSSAVVTEASPAGSKQKHFISSFIRKKSENVFVRTEKQKNLLHKIQDETSNEARCLRLLKFKKSLKIKVTKSHGSSLTHRPSDFTFGTEKNLLKVICSNWRFMELIHQLMEYWSGGLDQWQKTRTQSEFGKKCWEFLTQLTHQKVFH